jgi:hypothetical protein
MKTSRLLKNRLPLSSTEPCMIYSHERKQSERLCERLTSTAATTRRESGRAVLLGSELLRFSLACHTHRRHLEVSNDRTMTNVAMRAADANADLSWVTAHLASYKALA